MKLGADLYVLIPLACLKRIKIRPYSEMPGGKRFRVVGQGGKVNVPLKYYV